MTEKISALRSLVSKLNAQYSGRFANAILGTAGLKVANMLLTVLTGVALARMLGPDNYGIYVFVFSVIAVINIPISAGLPVLVVREVAKYRCDGAWSKIKGLVAVSNYYLCAYLCFVTMAFYLYVDEVVENKVLVLSFGLLMLPFLGIASLRMAVLRGLNHAVLGQIPESLLRPLVLLSALVACYIFAYEVDPMVALQANLLAVFVAFVLGIYFLIRVTPTSVKNSQPEYELGRWTKSLLPLMMFAVLKNVDLQVSYLFLSVLSTNTEVALFRVAMQGAILISLALSILNVVLAPYVVKFHHSNDINALKLIVRRSVNAAFIFGLCLFSFFCLFSEALLNLVFGKDYNDASVVLLILSFGQLVNVAMGSVALVINMTGNERYSYQAMAIGLITNISLSYWLVPEYGAQGAAVGALLSIVIWNVVLAIVVYRKIGIKTWFGRMADV